MVELKHDDVRFPAVCAGISLEVVGYKRTDAFARRFAVLFGFGDNPFAMLRVMPAARFPLLLTVIERHGAGI